MAGEKPKYLNEEVLRNLKHEIDEVMREVDNVEHDRASEPGGINMDKLWDDYLDMRDNSLTAHVPLDFKDGSTYKDKVIMRADDHQALLTRLQAVTLELSEVKAKIDERDNMIWDLRAKLDNERKSAKWTKNDKLNRVIERNELEDFFLECVDEVRKDIVKRKSTSAQLSVKKNMKKSASSKAIEADDDDAKLDHYTATDKKKVIELLMSNENVLLFLYEKLFPAVQNQQTQAVLKNGYSNYQS